MAAVVTTAVAPPARALDSTPTTGAPVVERRVVDIEVDGRVAGLARLNGRLVGLTTRGTAPFSRDARRWRTKDTDGIEATRVTGMAAFGVTLVAVGSRVQVYRLADAGPEGGEVVMGEASQAGATGPSVVVDLVERHTTRADNIAKLSAASDRSERHLFIWVENSQHAAVATFAFSNLLPDGAHLPDRAPVLPHCVDVVWTVTGYDNAHIWQYHRLHGWRDLGTCRREPSPVTKD